MMQFYTLFAAAAIYVALIAQVIYACPVPARLQATTRDALEVPFADLSVRYNQPVPSEDLVTRDWRAHAKKLLPWKKKDAPAKPVQIMVKTEVMQHHDTLPHQQIQHPIPKVDGKYHRVQMHGGGPRPQKKHHGIAITTDEPAIAKPVPIRPVPSHPHGGANVWKPLPAIPQGNP